MKRAMSFLSLFKRISSWIRLTLKTNKHTKLYDNCGQTKPNMQARSLHCGLILLSCISISFSSAGQLNKNKNFAKNSMSHLIEILRFFRISFFFFRFPPIKSFFSVI